MKQWQRTGSNGAQVAFTSSVDAAGEVVARGHPHAAAVLDTHLRRAEHVAGRVQADAHAVEHHGLAVGQTLQCDVGAEPRAQHAFADRGGQIGAVAAARVVGVRVRDHRARHRPPGVDVEVARRAIQAFGAQHDQVARIAALCKHRASVMPASVA